MTDHSGDNVNPEAGVRCEKLFPIKSFLTVMDNIVTSWI